MKENQGLSPVFLERPPTGRAGETPTLPVMRSPSRAVATGESAMDPMADSYGGMCNFPLRVSVRNPKGEATSPLG